MEPLQGKMANRLKVASFFYFFNAQNIVLLINLKRQFTPPPPPPAWDRGSMHVNNYQQRNRFRYYCHNYI
jgi:hypothetical protein